MLPWLKRFTRGRIGRNLQLFGKERERQIICGVEIDWGFDAFSKASRCPVKLSRQFTIACRSANRTLKRLRDISPSRVYSGHRTQANNIEQSFTCRSIIPTNA